MKHQQYITKTGVRTLCFLSALGLLTACDVDQTEEGEMPEVSVEEGNLPEYDVESKVEVGTTEETVTVPEISWDEDAGDEGVEEVAENEPILDEEGVIEEDERNLARGEEYDTDTP